jgi:hypothetical protein
MLSINNQEIIQINDEQYFLMVLLDLKRNSIRNQYIHEFYLHSIDGDVPVVFVEFCPKKISLMNFE